MEFKHVTVKTETSAKTLYGLYKVEGGLRFTGIMSDSEENIVKYLDSTYRIVVTDDDGNKASSPCWNKNAFYIKKMNIEMV